MEGKYTVELNAGQLDTILASLEALYGPSTSALVEYLQDVRDGVTTAVCQSCGKAFKTPIMGRPALYCGRTCAQRAYRQRASERRKQYGRK